jgi:hypothetical protein
MPAALKLAVFALVAIACTDDSDFTLRGHAAGGTAGIGSGGSFGKGGKGGGIGGSSGADSGVGGGSAGALSGGGTSGLAGAGGVVGGTGGMAGTFGGGGSTTCACGPYGYCFTCPSGECQVLPGQDCTKTCDQNNPALLVSHQCGPAGDCSAGSTTDCTPYACDWVTLSCRLSCKNSNECATNYACDGGQCVPCQRCSVWLCGPSSMPTCAISLTQKTNLLGCCSSNCASACDTTVCGVPGGAPTATCKACLESKCAYPLSTCADDGPPQTCI